jgi:hypothetical protein
VLLVVVLLVVVLFVRVLLVVVLIVVLLLVVVLLVTVLLAVLWIRSDFVADLDPTMTFQNYGSDRIQIQNRILHLKKLFNI